MAEVKPAEQGTVEMVDPDLAAEKIVADAEAAANEAQELLDALELRVQHGDESIAREDVETAVGNRNWLRKLVSGAQVRADRLREENRQTKLKALVAEAEAYNPGADIYDLGTNLEAAIYQFVMAFVVHNHGVAALRQRAIDLGVPAWSAGKFASSKDAYLEWADDGRLRVGERELQPIRSGTFIDRILGGVFANVHSTYPDVDRSYFTSAELGSVAPLDEVHDALRKLAEVHKAEPKQGFYYRSAEWQPVNPNSTSRQYVAKPILGAAVYRLAEELSRDEQIKRGLISISEAEARGDA
ncbi:MAG: hypothetical protein ACTHJI_04210 [Leifsonia sp.]